MADERLEAQITLDERGFTVAMDKVIARLDGLERASAGIAEKLDSAFTKGLGSVKKQVAGLNLNVLDSKLREAAKKAQVALEGLVSPAQSFDAAMRNVNSIARLSEEQYNRFSEAILGVGRELGVGVDSTKAAEAAYQIMSAGVTNAADAQEVLRQSVIGSKAGLTDMATASDILTTAMNSYGVGAGQAAHINDVLFKTVELGKTTYGELAQSLGTVLPVAAANKISIEQLGAAVAQLTAKGLKTPEAVTALRAAIIALAAPTEEAKKAAGSFGLTLDSSTLASKGLVGALNEIFRATGGNQEALRKILGDVNGLTAALNLAGDGGVAYASKLAAVQGASGAASSAMAEQQKSFQAAAENFQGAVDALKVSVGQTLLPALTVVAKGAADVVNAINDLPAPAKAIGAAIAGMGALAVTGAAGLAGLAVAVTSTINAVQGLVAFDIATKAVLGFQGATVLMTSNVGAAIGRMTNLAGLGALVNIAFAATAGVIGGVAIAVYAYTKTIEANTKAQEELLQIEERRARALKEGKDLIGKSAADLRSQGKTAKDLVDIIGGLQDQAGAAHREGNTQLEQTLNAQIADLQKVKTELAQDAAKVPKPDVSGIEAAHSANAKELERERKQRIADQLQEIAFSDQTNRQKIKALEDLAARENATGAERRRINSEIHKLQVKDERDAASERKKLAKDGLKDKLAEINQSKTADAEKIKRLQDVLKYYKLEGDQRRAVEAEIDRLQDRTAKAQEDRLKRLADLQANAARQTQDASERRVEGLRDQQSRGADVATELKDELAKQAEAQKQEIRAKLEKALEQNKGEENDKIRVELRRQANVDIAAVDEKLKTDTQQIDRDQVQDEARKQAELLDLQRTATSNRIEFLKDEAKTGKANSKQVQQAILDRLKIEEKRIRVEADAAKAATDNVQKQALIEQNAQASIVQARKAARDEILQTNEALDESIRKVDQLKRTSDQGFDFTTGNVLSLQDAFKGGSGSPDQFAARREAKRRGQVVAGSSEFIAATNLVGGIRPTTTPTFTGQPISVPTVVAAKAGGSPQKSAILAAATQTGVNVNVAGSVTIKTPDGKEVGKAPLTTEKVTVDGAGSSIGSNVRRMNSRRPGGF